MGIDALDVNGDRDCEAWWVIADRKSWGVCPMRSRDSRSGLGQGNTQTSSKEPNRGGFLGLDQPKVRDHG